MKPNRAQFATEMVLIIFNISFICAKSHWIWTTFRFWDQIGL